MKHTRNRRSNTSREFRLPANVMQEEAWDDEGPNMKLSRAFIVVLALHIVAVAGLMAFNFFEGRAGKAASAESAPAMPERNPIDTTVASLPTATVEPNKPVLPSGPVVMAGMKPIKVTSQRTTAVLAAEYGLSEAELLHMNRDVPLIKGVVLPGEVVYVPDTATKVAVDRLEVAPVAIPPRDETPPVTQRRPAPTVVKNSPPRTAPAPARPDVRERPPVVKSKPQAQPRPPRSSTKNPTVVKAKPKSSSGRTHTVGKGENLFRISLKYGVSVKAIQRANGISNAGHINAGQKLKIPAK